MIDTQPLINRLNILRFHVKDTTGTTIDGVHWTTVNFTDLHNAIDFFESTALAASKQGNTPVLRLNATLGAVQHRGAVSWSEADHSSVLAAWGVK